MAAAGLRSSISSDELACEPLLSCRSLLVASLVPVVGGVAVELGRHAVTAQGLLPAFKPLRLKPAALPRARRLAELALERLEQIPRVNDLMRVLARDGEFGATIFCEPGDFPWFSMVQQDGSGVVAMPAREAQVLARFFREIERELFDRGFAALDPALAH
jgi:hypothetical protein